MVSNLKLNHAIMRSCRRRRRCQIVFYSLACSTTCWELMYLCKDKVLSGKESRKGVASHSLMQILMMVSSIATVYLSLDFMFKCAVYIGAKGFICPRAPWFPTGSSLKREFWTIRSGWWGSGLLYVDKIYSALIFQQVLSLPSLLFSSKMISQPAMKLIVLYICRRSVSFLRKQRHWWWVSFTSVDHLEGEEEE